MTMAVIMPESIYELSGWWHQSPKLHKCPLWSAGGVQDMFSVYPQWMKWGMLGSGFYSLVSKKEIRG